MIEVSIISNQKVIRFYRADQEYGYFSNLFRKKIVFRDKEFESSEHAYQYSKIKKNRQKVRDWIMKAPYPYLLALVSHVLPYWDVVKGWSKNKVSIMYEILQIKFSDLELKEKLLATGNAKLIEASKTNSKTDLFWGEGKSGNGQNKLGELLMKVREELKREIDQSI